MTVSKTFVPHAGLTKAGRKEEPLPPDSAGGHTE